MATECGEITADILRDCDDKPVGGAENVMAVIPIEVWNRATKVFDVANPNIITTITLADGDKAFKFETYKRNFKPKFETQDTDWGAYYKHSIAAVFPTYTDSFKLQIPALTESYNVFIVENVKKTGVVFEVYGGTNGLRMPDLARDLAANEGTVGGTFTNDEDMNEPKVPYTFGAAATAYSAKKAAFDALFEVAA